MPCIAHQIGASSAYLDYSIEQIAVLMAASSN